MAFAGEVKKQMAVGSKILRFISNTKKIGAEKLTARKVKTRRALLESYWNDFTKGHYELCADTSFQSSDYAKEEVYVQVEEAYLEALDYLEAQLQKPEDSTGPNQCSQVPAVPGRLPKISLPTFSGDFLAWENFRDLFTSLVHEAPGLSDATRLQYLKTSVTGEAAQLLSRIPVTDANYQGAWNALVARFDKKRILLSHHLRRLLSLKPMTTKSATELKTLLDSTTEIRRALESLGRPVQYFDDFFVHLTAEKLEYNLQMSWEDSLCDGTHIPTFDELYRFLTNRITTLDTVASSKPPPSKTVDSRFKRSEVHTHATNSAPSTSQTCALCRKPHFIGYCPQFRQKTSLQRREIIKQQKLCTNCLRNHSATSCPSLNRCRVCSLDHHTLLHPDDAVASTTPGSVSTAHVQTMSARTFQPTLLATALVRVTSPSGQSAVVRALLDQGSEATFISENLTQRLRLSRAAVHVPVFGIGATPCGTVKAKVQIQLSAAFQQNSASVNATALLLPRLTRMFRPPKVNSNRWPHLKGLPLSDQDSSSISRVDLVIGADLYGEILLDGVVKGPPGSPIAQRTLFGWVLSGPLESDPITSHTPVTTFHCSVDLNLTEELRKFWEIEEGLQHSTLTPEEQDCEEYFKKTYTRAPDGRFIVRLPKRSNVPLGNSYSAALRSFHRSEIRRQGDAQLDQAYRAFMQEYIDLGHMSPVPPASSSSTEFAYLPHHAVWKTDKIRVVFNASARTSSGHSLNDALLPGPRLQQELSHVLLRWRKHAVVFTADVVKMFRQIWIHPEDRSLQRILWRESPNQKLQEFQLNTVTYGTACAPYLAIRCLIQLAKEEADRFPEAANVIQTQTYVDDILAGADTLEEACRLKQQLQRLLMAGGFELAKWASNSPAITGTSANALTLTDGTVKTLGLQWHPDKDTFRFQVTLETPRKITKRAILSCIAKLFDPLGWLAPVLITAKMFIQDLWTVKTDWDSGLPKALEESWNSYYSSLQRLDRIRIPRWITLCSNCTWEIHGFCDASQRAYAAAVYLRVTNPDSTVQTHLLTAKTKVAPIKVLSLPRLELCGALLLARLLRQVEDIFQGAANIYAWTDSQVVLCWLRAHPSKWKCFVANRTSEIHQLLPKAIWNHVPSRDNAADSASRGIPADQLETEDLWWHGPSWLSQPFSDWPKPTTFQNSPAVIEEENTKALRSLLTTTNQILTLQDRYSSLLRLLRITAWILRFNNNSRSTPDTRTSGPLTTSELSSAQKVWIKLNQVEVFQNEIQALTRSSPLQRGSALLPLRPFLDADGLLRVGGRLEHGPLDYGEKHPYIIPAKCNFSRLLVLDAHHRVLHGGPQLTLSQLSRRFWIIRGRRLVRDIVHSCVRCARYAAKTDTPLMGQLPAARVTPSRPFQNTGLDYAGPIQIRSTKGRGHKAYKGYIALFVCMSTKAVHLEAVSDCTTQGFLAAFKRFCARRGIPATISSDQATNFRGADAELQRLLQTASAENRKIAEFLANDGTQWRFIPPHSPHFGGLWEAGVRSVKHHLRRVIGDHTLTFEELTTVLTEIEACLNSRPLTPLSSSPQDVTALTPGHFLIGTSLKTLPEPSLLETNENRLNRWQLLRRLYEQFWRRWSTEYLQNLQQRSKWQHNATSLQVNDLVLVKEDNIPPSKWSLGRVLQLHPGSDGISRVATIRTATSELVRPVVKLCRLPPQH